MPSPAKALVLQSKQGAFIVKDVAVRQPTSGEILIKIHATSLNPVDWKIHKWGIAFEDYPAVLGYDIAGEVVELGEGVADFAVGDRVFGQAHFEPDRGSFQQYIIALATNTAKIPPNITFDQAATIPVVLTAAYIGLYNQVPHGLGLVPPLSKDTQGKYTGVPIVVTGGTSSVGQMALQLAHLSGFSPIITTANPKHTDRLKSLGATVVLDRNLSHTALIEEVKKLIKGDSLQYVYDAISSDETQKLSLDLLADGGKVAVVTPPVITSTDTKTVIHVFGSLRAPNNIALLETLYHDHLFGLVEQGLIKPNNVEVLPNGLAGIPAGLDKLEANQVSGRKLIAHPQETV